MTARDVILAIVRYRLLTVELATKILGMKRDAADKLLRELEGRGVLQSQVITGRQKVYFLSAATCRKYGQPENRARPFAAQGLITNLGILMYCARHGVKRFMKSEVAELAPKLLVPGASADRYAMPEPNQLRLLIVDHGSSSVRRLAGKVRREWEKRREHYDWQLLQDHHQFGIVVIMAHQEKARRLRSMLNDDHLTISVEVYP